MGNGIEGCVDECEQCTHHLEFSLFHVHAIPKQAGQMYKSFFFFGLISIATVAAVDYAGRGLPSQVDWHRYVSTGGLLHFLVTLCFTVIHKAVTLYSHFQFR